MRDTPGPAPVCGQWRAPSSVGTGCARGQAGPVCRARLVARQRAHRDRDGAGRWLVDDVEVPDPASRYNPEGPHSPSEIVDPRAFAWQDAGWRGRPWHEVVLYELHLGTFTPEGTFDAAARQLPALARLGVTAVQVMPLAGFPGRFGWGYDGVLHFAPHAAYGRPDDFKRFVQAAHAEGLMVFVDVVYNHFGPDGNYLHAYAPDFFSATHDSPWGRAINLDGPGSRTVRDFFIANALYWLEEFHVDGLRLDAVHAIVDGSEPHFLEELSVRARAHLPGRHVHLVVEDDHNVVGRLAAAPRPGHYDGQWTGDFHHLLHVLLTGESGGYYAEFNGDTLAQLARCLMHGTAWLGVPPVARPDGGAREPSHAPAPLGAIVNFLQNHDQVGNRALGERLGPLARAYRPEAGDAPLQLATALLLLAPHTPMLFMGQEWNAATPFLYFADWGGAGQAELRRAVTEGRRREFPQFHGGDASRIPDPCDAATPRASQLDRSELEGEAAVHWQSFTARLLALRQAELTAWLPTLSADGHTAQVIEGRGLWVRWSFAGGRVLEIALNFSDEVLAVPALANALDDDEAARIILQLRDAEQGYLAPWGGHWRWRETTP
ncbi:MAG: malto-oligosyltrehalose trehalohydrolase [Lysobacteraceae bacterium]|nr:MAG: malto-oligosyltrehalose trehalohydrolase [Xanthomonadaceae bacterium]